MAMGHKTLCGYKITKLLSSCFKRRPHKSAKIDETFTVELTLCCKCQIDGEDYVNFCGLLRKHKLYINRVLLVRS